MAHAARPFAPRSGANDELTGKFWSEAEKLVRVKRFVMGQFD